MVSILKAVVLLAATMAVLGCVDDSANLPMTSTTSSVKASSDVPVTTSTTESTTTTTTSTTTTSLYMPGEHVLNFTPSECTGTIEYQRSNKLEAEWLDDWNLKVETYEIINCGNRIGAGDFEIGNDTITLKYQNIGEDLANCICGHNLTFMIHDLRKKDYNIWMDRVKIKRIE